MNTIENLDDIIEEIYTNYFYELHDDVGECNSPLEDEAIIKTYLKDEILKNPQKISELLYD